MTEPTPYPDPPDPPTPPPPNLIFWEIYQLNGQRVVLNLAHVGVLIETEDGSDVVTADGGAFATALSIDECLAQIADLRAGKVLAPEPPENYIFKEEPLSDDPS